MSIKKFVLINIKHIWTWTHGHHTHFGNTSEMGNVQHQTKMGPGPMLSRVISNRDSKRPIKQNWSLSRCYPGYYPMNIAKAPNFIKHIYIELTN